MTASDSSRTNPALSRTITARSPDDLLAAIPVLLGFTPTESVVMVTFGATGSFHARVDLPLTPQTRNNVIEVLLAPVLAHGVSKVAFVVYAAKPTSVRSLTAALVASFEDQGIYVLDALHADGAQWFPALPGVGLEAKGVEYAERTHPIALQAVVDGHLLFASRAELAESLRGDQGAVDAVGRHLTPTRPVAGRQVPAEAAWVTGLLSRHLDAQTLPDSEETARLLTALHDVRIRDAAWCFMTPDNAKGLVDLWKGVVRKSPISVLAAPATLLAFAAWLSGHGALAWCALDRCKECDRDYSLAQLLASMLDRAVPPSAWIAPTELISELAINADGLPGR
jgi:Domain of unknown function (DUF4192)